MNTLRNLVALALRCLSPLRPLAPLLARVIIGVIFVESGWGKMHNIPKVTEFFASLGLPAPGFQAHLVATTELVCGSLVLLGLFTRLACIPLAITMIVALATAKREDIHELSDLFAASEFLYIALMAWLVVEGPGLLSLDTFVKRKL